MLQQKNSIKVIFPTETEIDKVMNASEYFKMHNLNPKMNLKSKNNRTVFCKNLDPAILSTYNGEEIKNMILQQGWNIKEVYIIRNKNALKIVMKELKQVQEFIDSSNTQIGKIQFEKYSLENTV